MISYKIIHVSVQRMMAARSTGTHNQNAVDLWMNLHDLSAVKVTLPIGTQTWLAGKRTIHQ